MLKVGIAAGAEHPLPGTAERDRLLLRDDAPTSARLCQERLDAEPLEIRLGTTCSLLSAGAPQKTHGPPGCFAVRGITAHFSSFRERVSGTR